MPPKAQQKKKPVKRRRLKPGTKVNSESAQFNVLQVLGSGGFGDVYLVQKKGDESGNEYALKTEFNDPQGRKMLDRLKVEMGVFQEVTTVKDPGKAASHFVKMIDKGRTDEFKFIVMGLVSYSIEAIRKDVLKTQIRWPSVFRIGLQTLDAIRDLHALGYIHRDIKPHNFAIGRPPQESLIYMLDFGIARKYLQPDGLLRMPRCSVKFLGTVKFASRNSHHRKEQSRKDDLEVWTYMLMDLFRPANLIWRKETDRELVLNLKEMVYKKPSKLYTLIDCKLPEDFDKIITTIDKLKFETEPSYVSIAQQLRACALKNGCKLNVPFEWIGKTCQKLKKRKKSENQLEDDENDDSEERRRRERKKKERKNRKKGEKKRTQEDIKRKQNKDESDDDDDDDEEEEEDDSEDLEDANVIKDKKTVTRGQTRDTVESGTPGKKKEKTSPGKGSKRKQLVSTRTRTRTHVSRSISRSPVDGSPKKSPASDDKSKAPASTGPTDDVITVEPSECKFESGGKKHIYLTMENKSDDRIVLKSKCSNNTVYRIEPVYAFIEAKKRLNLCIRRTDEYTKGDKIVLVIARCKPEDKSPSDTIKATPLVDQIKLTVNIICPPKPPPDQENVEPRTDN